MRPGSSPPLAAQPCRILACLCVAVGLLVRPAAAAEVPRTLAQAQTGLTTAELVNAILGYTVWIEPDRNGLLLCVSRGAVDAEAILAHAKLLRLRWPVSGRTIEPDEPPPAPCDVIIFEGWQALPQRQALRSLAGRPVLSIGQGSEFCSDGGLFCLTPDRAGLRFEVNLDAVSRSGLRVHPQVLRLARPRPQGGVG